MSVKILIATCCLCIFQAVPVQAQVGIITTIEGNVRLHSGKEECGLRHGLELEERDIIRTDTNAWASLRFLDETRVTIRPSSEVHIRTYRLAGGEAPQLERVLYLAAGSLRVLSGHIPVNRDAIFVVQTAEAQAGLRGQDNEIAYFAGPTAQRGAMPGTYVRAHEGETSLKNDRGEMVVRAGQVGHSDTSARVVPRVLPIEPAFYSTYAHIDRRAETVRAEVQKDSSSISVP